MNVKTFLLSAALLVGGGFAAAATLQEGMPMAKPGAEHALLAKMAGSWHAESEVMGMKARGTYERTLEMGGLWLTSRYEGELMGSPFQGLEVLGYDPAKGKYVSTWVDSTAPNMVVQEGEWDEEAKTMTLLSTGMNPMTGEESLMSNVLTVKSDDHMVFTMHMGEASTPAMMKIEYKRKK